MSGTEFLIQIQQRISGDNPVTELQKTEAALRSAMDRYKELEKTAANAAKGLDRATANVAATQAKLQAAAKSGDAGQVAKMETALAKAVAKQRELAQAAEQAGAALREQQDVVSELADNFEQVQAASEGAGVDLEATAKTGDGLAKLGGPLGRVGTVTKDVSEAWTTLTQQLGTGGAVFAVGAVAVAALAVALVAAAAAAAKFVLASANAARQAALTNEAFRIQVGASQDLVGAMGEVERSTGIAADRQREIVKGLKDAGVDASQWPKALEAIAKSEAALGDSSGTQALIDSLKDGKTSVDDLGAEIESKFGDIARKKMLGLDQQSARLGRNVSGIFAGLDIEPVLEGFARLVSLFDTSTESGAALKAIAGAIFQPLFNASTTIFPKIERFFLGMILGALNVGVAVKKMAAEFGFDLGGAEDWPDLAAVGEAVAYGLAAAVAVVAAGLYVVIAVVQQTIAAWRMMSDAATAVGDAITSAWDAAVAWLEGKSLADVGEAMIDGLVAGIKAGASKVVDALGGVVTGAVDNAKSILGIASPSKVFREIGANTSEGLALGVDDGAGEAQDAMAALVEPPQPVAGAAPVAARGGGVTISIGTLILGGGSARQMVDEFLAALTERLEAGALQVGAATEAG